MTKKLSGVWLIFFAALCWSLSAPLVKLIDLDPLFLCGLRSLIAGVTLVPFIRPHRLRFNRWTLFYLICYCGLCICYIQALLKVGAAISLGMQYTATIWLFLIGLATTRKFRWRASLPVALLFLGVFFFMSAGFSGGDTAGILFAFAEGILFAMMTLSGKKIAGGNPLGLTAVANLFTGLFIFIFLPPAFGQLATLDGKTWMIMILLGSVQIGLGYGLYNLGLTAVPPQRASLVAIWEMILAPLWVAIFFGEIPSLPVLAGLAVILAGIVLDGRLKSSEISLEAQVADKPQLEVRPSASEALGQGVHDDLGS